MTPDRVRHEVLGPALSLLPKPMRSESAQVLLLAIGLQESRFTHRRQINGPARGYWQFECGTQESRGGVWGIYLHRDSRNMLDDVCRFRDVAFVPRDIHVRMEYDDVLSACCARLLLWTDPKPLPAPDDCDGGWDLYLRTWRPGKPHPHTWPELHAIARKAVQ